MSLTVAAALAAAAVQYGGSALGEDVRPRPRYRAELRILVNPLPSDISRFVGIEPHSLFQSVLIDPSVVAESFHLFSTALESVPTSQAARLETVRNLISSDAYSVRYESGSRLMYFSYTSPDAEVSRDVVTEVYSNASTEFGRRMQPIVADAAEAVSRGIADTRSSITDLLIRELEAFGMADLVPANVASLVDQSQVARLANLELSRNQLVELDQSPERLLTQLGEPLVFQEEPTNPTPLVIIATITAFFLAVFLAFVLEYVRRVQQEPEEMEKLKAAWKGRD